MFGATHAQAGGSGLRQLWGERAEGKQLLRGGGGGGGALRLQNTEVRFKLKITRMGSFKIITVKQRREFSKYK